MQVINPITGKSDTLQNTLDDFFRIFTSQMTVKEIDDVNLSARQFDNIAEPVSELDFFGKNYIIRRTFKCPARTKHTC